MTGELQHRPIRPGVGIASDMQHNGALGGIVRDVETNKALLLSAQHVLMSPAGDGRIWQPAPCGEPGCDCNVVARTLRGLRSIVQWNDEWYYVDAGVATLEDDVDWEPGVSSAGIASVGTRVRKVGPTTGETSGVVVDDRYVDRVRFGSFSVEVPNQLRIQPDPGCPRFAADGDSGAVVFDEAGRAVGLVWGADGAGRCTACPIAPILDRLSVSFEW